MYIRRSYITYKGTSVPINYIYTEKTHRYKAMLIKEIKFGPEYH